jgi:UDPglucose 6-dehydrogenase
VVLGGTTEDNSRAADFYKHYYNAMVQFYLCDAVTAEVAKYMENSFYAVKVTFVNEFYDIAKIHGVNYDVLREIWLADTRISRDHTLVYPDTRGFSGKCLPKDVNAIVKSSQRLGYEPLLLKSTLEINRRFLSRDTRPPLTLDTSGRRVEGMQAPVGSHGVMNFVENGITDPTSTGTAD